MIKVMMRELSKFSVFFFHKVYYIIFIITALLTRKHNNKLS